MANNRFFSMKYTYDLFLQFSSYSDKKVGKVKTGQWKMSLDIFFRREIFGDGRQRGTRPPQLRCTQAAIVDVAYKISGLMVNWSTGGNPTAHLPAAQKIRQWEQDK